jgi:hypothetical protein
MANLAHIAAFIPKSWFSRKIPICLPKIGKSRPTI